MIVVVVLIVVALLALLAAWLIAFAPAWLWHPLGQCTPASSNHVIAVHEVVRCKSYNAWSGSFSDISEVTLIFTAITSAVAAWRIYKAHVECHVEGCSKHGYPVHGTPYRACHEHHPAAEHEVGEAITPDHIATAHGKVVGST